MPRTKPAAGQIVTIPANEDAEMSVLGAMLIEPKAIEKAVAALRPEDFYVPKHQVLFGIVEEMHRAGTAVDAVTLPDRVIADPRAAGFGGWSLLTALFERLPTAANVEYYCEIVKEKSTLRSLMFLGLEAGSLAQGPVKDAAALVENFQRKLSAIALSGSGAAFSPLSAALMELTDLAEERAANPVDTIGIPTGFEEVDMILSGLQGGGYYILAGRPSMGKSAQALGIGLNVAKAGKRVAIYTGEMARLQIAQRLVSYIAEVDSTALMTGRLRKPDYERATRVMGELYSLPFGILDTADTTTSSMAAAARAMQGEQGLDLLIVDHIGLMNTKRTFGTRREAIGDISHDIKKLAVDLNIPVLVLSQLSRAVQGRENKRPEMSDLRETGDLEQDADVVAFVYREGYYDHKETYLRNEDGSCAVENAEVIVRKNRLTGKVGTAAVGFKREFGKFCERPVMAGPTGY